MATSCIKYFLLLQGVYATCKEDTVGCNANSLSGQLFLVQRQAVKSEKKSPGAIEPWKCFGPHASDPLQVLGDHTDEVAVKALHIADGKYKLLFSVSGISNGCDISPLSHQSYCSGGTGFLARFDANQIHYVAKLPFSTFAAAFGYVSDNFYFTSFDQTSKQSDIYVLPGVDSLTGFLDSKADSVADKTGLTPFVRGIDGMLADLVVLKGDFDGTGDSDYVVGLANGNNLYLIKPDGQMWQLTFEGNWGWNFGAGWNFQNEAFFAANNGAGVVQVDKDSIDLEQGTVSVYEVGLSEPTDANDGMNCHNAPKPGDWQGKGKGKGKPPTPAPTETCDTGDCIIWGDPHIITFDVHHKREMEHPAREAFFRTRSWKSDQVTVADQGTFWLVKSEDVHIQARYWKNTSNASWTNLGSLAVGGPFLKNNTFVIRPLTGPVTWNGEEVLSHLGSEFSNDLIHAKYHKHAEIVKDGRRGIGIEVSLPQDVKLTVNRWKQGLAAKISMCKRPEQDGQCGNFNGDPKDDVPEVLLARAGHRLAEKDWLPWASTLANTRSPTSAAKLRMHKIR